MRRERRLAVGRVCRDHQRSEEIENKMAPLASAVRQAALALDAPAPMQLRHQVPFEEGAAEPFDAEASLPPGSLTDHQTALPRIAKHKRLLAEIERRLPQIPTRHHLFNADARSLAFIPSNSVHLILTSPPYWTLKEYREHPDQLGGIGPYEEFLAELEKEFSGGAFPSRACRRLAP